MNNQSSWVEPSSWNAPDESDRSCVSELLGKEPQGQYCVVVRAADGTPSVIENAPFFFDGTPMPTRYWLVDSQLSYDISQLESNGGVKRAEDSIDMDAIMETHHRYEVARDAMIASDYNGPRPSGGVGGTRRGVKCLHAHVAHFLTTGQDVVGQWTMNEIARMKADVQ